MCTYYRGASCWSNSFSLLLLLLVPMIPTWKGTNQESCLKLIWSTRWCESWMSVFDLRKIILYTFKEKRIAIWLLNNYHPLSAVKSFLSALDSNLQLLEISRGQLISFDLQVFQEKLIERGKEKKKNWWCMIWPPTVIGIIDHQKLLDFAAEERYLLCI